MHTKLWSRNLKGRYHSEDRNVDGRIIFKMDGKETGCEDVDWIILARDREQWRVHVYTIMNLLVA
jgi:hypothetical protein